MKNVVDAKESSFKDIIKKDIIKNVILMIFLFVAASAIGYLFEHIGVDETNIVVVYLLAVLVTAWLTQSFLFGMLSSLLATFLFSYLFTEPYNAFAVNDPNYIITFIIMTIAALITSTLTYHAKLAAKNAQEKEAETKAIYNLTNHLTDAKNIHDIAGIAVKVISSCFSCKAACLCFDESGMPEQSFIQQVSDDNHVRRAIADIQEYKHKIDGMRTGFDEGNEFFDWPIYGSETTLGVIRIPKENAQNMNEAQNRLLRAMIESTALAMDRFRSSEQRMKSREEIVKERYRGNLLRAISHDLRTPLSGIIGTAEMLADMTKSEESQHSLAEDIRKEADWLHSLVENILNLTRLQDGSLTLKKQMEAVEEIIGGAVAHMAKRAPDYDIRVSMPDELILVPMDAKLIEQALINLLDNAVNHSNSEGEISITVIKNESARHVKFMVQDRGTGIAMSDLPHIFQMFYTSHPNHADARHGIGLGLAICETIVKAHGGNIAAKNRADGLGAEFTFTLPMEEQDEPE
ncbi:DUF4118 domain-containing protein [Eubacteriales bacterium OttesenSCG-928-K08]|nr:DUF4118 domain-containing protein [Eubacteriales bacterium OttesenSCG-928-K08]